MAEANGQRRDNLNKIRLGGQSVCLIFSDPPLKWEKTQLAPDDLTLHRPLNFAASVQYLGSNVIPPPPLTCLPRNVMSSHPCCAWSQDGRRGLKWTCFLFLRAHSKLNVGTSSFCKELWTDLEKRWFLPCKYREGSCSLSFPEQILQLCTGLLE